MNGTDPGPRVCQGGGSLVGSRFEVPGDPSRCYQGESTFFGCNRLHCSGCRSEVRYFTGYRLHPGRLVRERDKLAGTAPQLAAADLERLHACADPAAEPALERSDAHRAYACRCAGFDTQAVYTLSLGDWADLDSWHCSGHPA